jgi:hypothetical protein
MRWKFSRNIPRSPTLIKLETFSKIPELQITMTSVIVNKEKAWYILTLVNLIPTCAKCGSPVTDSLDPEVEEQGQLKKGKYINNIWMCNECVDAQRSSNNGRGNQELGKASSADVSPNTPRADEANL